MLKLLLSKAKLDRRSSIDIVAFFCAIEPCVLRKHSLAALFDLNIPCWQGCADGPRQQATSKELAVMAHVTRPPLQLGALANQGIRHMRE